MEEAVASLTAQVHLYVCMHRCMHMHMCVCMHICMHMHMCVCRYICMHVQVEAEREKLAVAQGKGAALGTQVYIYVQTHE